MTGNLGAGVPPDFLYKQLSRFPSNLLRWFGIPSGQNPQEIHPSYQPILDLWEWLVTSPTNAAVIGPTAGVAVGGAIAGTVTIAQVNSHLFVRDYTIRCQPIPAGGGEFAICPTIVPVPAAGVEVMVGQRARTQQVGAATAGEIITCFADRPFFIGGYGAGANCQLSAIINCNTVAGAFQAFGYYRFVQLS